MDMTEVSEQLQIALEDLDHAMPLSKDMLVVVGTSTSEVVGSKIGSNGSYEAAKAMYDVIALKQKETGAQFAFQCCEHLNRALVIELEVAKARGYEIVSAVPIRKAGGAMATYAYNKMDNPVLVEEITCEAGIDIGDTLIGMHLRKVAIPIRSEITSIGAAHVTMAITRPKLIGGERAVYTQVN